MSENDVNAVGHQFGGGVGGHFRFTDIVFYQQFHLFTVDTAFGIVLGSDQFGSLDRRQTVRGKITALSPCNTELYGVSGKHTTRDGHGKAQGDGGNKQFLF